MNPLIALSYEVGNDVILGALLVGLVIFAGGLLSAMGVIKGWIREVAGVKETSTTEIAGQPIKMEMAKEFMTRDDHRSLFGNIDRRVTNLEARADRSDARMEDAQRNILAAGEDRATKIHDRINDIDRKVAGLDERTMATNSTLAVQDKKLDAILERL